MSMTTNSPTTTTGTAASTVDEKGWTDFLDDILPDVVKPVAESFGIDPRIAGQAMGQVLDIFGIGGGKAYQPAVSQDQAKAQLKQLVAPHLGDQEFKKALSAWLKVATEPVAAQKAGKAYRPDLQKDWFSDAFDWVGEQVSNVDWGEVGKVGLQALPYVMAAI